MVYWFWVEVKRKKKQLENKNKKINACSKLNVIFCNEDTRRNRTRVVCLFVC